MKKPTRDKKGHFRKHMDSLDEELETVRKIASLFNELEFKQSHLWIIWWLSKKYGVMP